MPSTSGWRLICPVGVCYQAGAIKRREGSILGLTSEPNHTYRCAMMRLVRSLTVFLAVTLTAATAHAVIGKEGPFPLPGLSDTEMAAFEAGAAAFLNPFTVTRGLGPV